ncbi:hypothetical protein CCACVL1_04676 [Corchorus capsularis]|uniref:Uncharacterized protein n=1 Tax=Corchorus capsularis TaxID=210143 RepID=A0A1R3JQI1_COCAP|nr:hypothetical protein CCACVL1_04676 [Corchorus capsularis]
MTAGCYIRKLRRGGGSHFRRGVLGLEGRARVMKSHWRRPLPMAKCAK